MVTGYHETMFVCVPFFLKFGLIGAHVGLEFQALCECI